MDEVVRIPPDDPIERLVVKSVRLGEIAAKMRREATGSDGIEEADRLDAASEKLWAEAKRLGEEYVTQKNYEDLANAFLKLCVEDYEDLISGAPEAHKKNIPLIEDVLEHQTFVKIDMPEQLKHVRSVYLYKFVPYAKRHAKEIKAEWDEFDRKKLEVRERIIRSKHHCPLCEGALKPRYIRGEKSYSIACTDCKLWY